MKHAQSSTLESIHLSPDLDRLFHHVKNLSFEIHSLIRQGVREGVEDRILHRNGLLAEWFTSVQRQIEWTDQQQEFLQDLLAQEQQLLKALEQEQAQLGRHRRASRQLSNYKSNQGY